MLAIQRRADGQWVPPGGVLELDEPPADGVAREVLKETGVQVRAERLTGVYKNMRLGVVSVAGGQHRPGRVDALQLERIEQSGKELADLGKTATSPS